jgi:NAD(P)-dependent dehydrogenase (short-subunit alcohol dehydrogenase family)
MPQTSGRTDSCSGDHFVTGGTGFLGRHLIDALLRRPTGRVFVLVRERSLGRLEDRRAASPAASERVIPVVGDLRAPGVGIAAEQLAALRGRVGHFFHVGGLHDTAAPADALREANVVGTMQALHAAERMAAGCFHHVSSIAAAGRYAGTFREDMFTEAGDLHDAYFRTKHEAEAVVRATGAIPWRIYRPSLVVGHSVSGEIDELDGLYYFFPLLARLGTLLPPFVPLPGIGGGALNLVPVDFVAAAIEHIARQPGLDGRAFHLVDPVVRTVGETLDVFAKAAGAPRLSLRAPMVDGAVVAALRALAGNGNGKGLAGRLLHRVVGIPPRVLDYLDNPTRFDCRQASAALAGSGIAVPPLESYAPQLWQYWERNFHVETAHRRGLEAAVRGRHVLITGASSGIGRATALKVGAAGGHVILVARRADRLAEVQRLVEHAGGTASAFAADLTSPADVERLCAAVLEQFGGVDVLVNNAGRSIRRSLSLEEDRFHDFERTMHINYFAALRLILRLVPAMRRRGQGHVINVSSMGAQVGPPRFSAYVASKAALDAFSRCVAPELLGDGIDFTTVYMPLVRTDMIAPTRLYDSFSTLTAAQAADLICDAIVDRPKQVSSWLGLMGQVGASIAPSVFDVGLYLAYRLFPDSAAAQGKEPHPDEQAGSLGKAFARLLPGIHW